MSDSSVTNQTAIPETSVAGSVEQAPAEQAPDEQAPDRPAEQTAPAPPRAVPGSIRIAGIAAMLLAVVWCGVAAWVGLVYIRNLELAASLGYYMSEYMKQATAQQQGIPYVPPEIPLNLAVPPATRLLWLAILWIVGLWAWLAGFLPVVGKKIGRPTLAFGIVLLIASAIAYYDRLLDITPGVILGFLAVASILSGLLASAGAHTGRRMFRAAGILMILSTTATYAGIHILTTWGGFPSLPPGTLVMVCAAQILLGLVYLAFSFAMPKRLARST